MAGRRRAIFLPTLEVGADRGLRGLGDRGAEDHGVAVDGGRLWEAIVARPAAGAVLGLVGGRAAHADVAHEFLADAVMGEHLHRVGSRRDRLVGVIEPVPHPGLLARGVGLRTQGGADDPPRGIADREAHLAGLVERELERDVPFGPPGDRLLD